MLWVIVLVGIALLGAAMIAGYAIWLWHKAADVLAEFRVVGDRLGELGELMAGLELPGPPPQRLGPPVLSLTTGRVRFAPDPWDDDDDDDDLEKLAEQEDRWSAGQGRSGRWHAPRRSSGSSTAT